MYLLEVVEGQSEAHREHQKAQGCGEVAAVKPVEDMRLADSKRGSQQHLHGKICRDSL